MTEGSKDNALGFTLVEALVSIVLLAIMASLMSALFMGGLQTIHAQGDEFLIDSVLRSKMEYLVSLEFDQLASGSEPVTIAAQSLTLTWTVTPVDLDADAVNETDAVKIVLDLGGQTLAGLRVDNAGRVTRL